MAAPAEESRVNPFFLNQAGQDTVQDIVIKSQEIFQNMKMISLPSGTAATIRNSQEKMNKLKDSLSVIEKLFKRLRVIYTEHQKHITEIDDITSLVPIVQSKDGDDQEKPTKSATEQVLEQRKKDLETQLRLKNQQLHQLQTMMRKLVWDMNAISSCMGMKTEKQTPSKNALMSTLFG